MTDTAMAVPAVPHRQSLTGFTPRDAKGLAWLANEVVKSGMFMVGRRVMTGSEAFVVMMKGAELGLTPMQSLAEISIIKGRPFVSKDVLTARITRSPRCKAWDPSDCDATHCTIRFQVAGGDPTSLTTLIDDIPQRYFKPSSTGEPSNWTLVPEDMLFSWTVRRIARRWFPEALLDIGDASPDYDETRVINVAAVERATLANGAVDYGDHEGCPGDPRGQWYLFSNQRTGGAYLRCDGCNATKAPPDAVRDLVRGTPEALTLAGPELEAGERALTPEEIDTLDTMQGVHNAEDQAVYEQSHREGTAAIQHPTVNDPSETDGTVNSDEEVMPSSNTELLRETAPPPEPANEAGAPHGATLPLGEAQDSAFMEAAGIAQEAAQPETPPMTHAEVDVAVQAVLKAVTHARAVGKLEPARTILHASGYDDTPLSSWLIRHPAELPGLVAAFAEPAG